MRSLALLAPALLATLALGPLVTAQDAPDPKARLEADPPAIEFGDAFQGEVLFQEVTVTNSGEAPYPIGRILTSCGCTVPTLRLPDGSEVPVEGANGVDPIHELAPGESAIIDVHFKTAGKQGLVRQQVTVQGVHPQTPKLSIPLTVRVSTPLTVDPPWLNFGSIAKGANLEKTVKLQALSLGDWKVTGFENQLEGREIPHWIQFELMEDKGDVRELKVKIVKASKVGPFNERVRILTDHERVPSVDLSLAGIVEPSVSFDTGSTGPAQSIVFEKVAPQGYALRTLKIRNADPSTPYDLKSVDVVTGHDRSEFFETVMREIEPGMVYEVDLRVNGEIGGGVDENGTVKSPFFRGSLRLNAEHADVERKLIQFHGWVKPEA